MSDTYQCRFRTASAKVKQVLCSDIWDDGICCYNTSKERVTISLEFIPQTMMDIANAVYSIKKAVK